MLSGLGWAVWAAAVGSGTSGLHCMAAQCGLQQRRASTGWRGLHASTAKSGPGSRPCMNKTTKLRSRHANLRLERARLVAGRLQQRQRAAAGGRRQPRLALVPQRAGGGPAAVAGIAKGGAGAQAAQVSFQHRLRHNIVFAGVQRGVGGARVLLRAHGSGRREQGRREEEAGRGAAARCRSSPPARHVGCLQGPGTGVIGALRHFCVPAASSRGLPALARELLLAICPRASPCVP